jgi:hypothetical protein
LGSLFLLESYSLSHLVLILTSQTCTLFITLHHFTSITHHTTWVSSVTTTTTTRRRATTAALPTAVTSKALAALAVPVSVALRVALKVALNITVALAVLEDSVVLEANREDQALEDLRVDLEALEVLAVPAVITAAPEALEDIMVDLEVPEALAVTREVYVYPSLAYVGGFADGLLARWLVDGLIDCRHHRSYIYQDDTGLMSGWIFHCLCQVFISQYNCHLAGRA